MSSGDRCRRLAHRLWRGHRAQAMAAQPRRRCFRGLAGSSGARGLAADGRKPSVRNRAETKAKPRVPWGRLTLRILPVTITYFCYGWSFWLFITWLPSFFKVLVLAGAAELRFVDEPLRRRPGATDCPPSRSGISLPRPVQAVPNGRGLEPSSSLALGSSSIIRALAGDGATAVDWRE
jgi:hypothetical protein